MLWPRFCVLYGIRHIINLAQTRSIARWDIPNLEVHHIMRGYAHPHLKLPFFPVSGFLIVRSYVTHQSLKLFVQARVLPIMPGLIIAVLFRCSNCWWPETGVSTEVQLFFSAFIITLICAWLSCKLVEKLALRLNSKLTKKFYQQRQAGDY
jgi:peptidoglycan/LPS O-acetylase OafA/YrhL